MIENLINQYDNSYSRQAIFFGSKKRLNKLLLIIIFTFTLLYSGFVVFLLFDQNVLALISFALLVLFSIGFIFFIHRSIRKRFELPSLKENENEAKKLSKELLTEYLAMEGLTSIVDSLIDELNRRAELHKNNFYRLAIMIGLLLSPVWIEFVTKLLSGQGLFENVGLALIFALSISFLVGLIYKFHDNIDSKYSKLNKIINILKEIELGNKKYNESRKLLTNQIKLEAGFEEE